MLLFADAKLLIYAPPKTGTTALHHALGSSADLALRGPLKHMSVRAAHRRILPLVEGANLSMPEGFAVIREPVDWLHSWYRYRTRLPANDPKSTSGLSFNEFAEAYLRDERPVFASVGQQSRHLSGDGVLAPIHLFPHDQMDIAVDFLFLRLGFEFSLGWHNESPELEMDLSSQNREKLMQQFEPDLELYDRAVKYSRGFAQR